MVLVPKTKLTLTPYVLRFTFYVLETEVNMRAWLLEGARAVDERPLVRVDLALPGVGEHDLLIRVRACGVCHTDLHIVEGEIPLPRLPVVPGHQIVGTVEQVGPAVTGFHV